MFHALSFENDQLFELFHLDWLFSFGRTFLWILQAWFQNCRRTSRFLNHLHYSWSLDYLRCVFVGVVQIHWIVQDIVNMEVHLHETDLKHWSRVFKIATEKKRFRVWFWVFGKSVEFRRWRNSFWLVRHFFKESKFKKIEA